jgi:hypothetical protein
MKVAAWIPNVAHGQHLLPPSWMTLYDLSRLAKIKRAGQLLKQIEAKRGLARLLAERGR